MSFQVQDHPRSRSIKGHLKAKVISRARSPNVKIIPKSFRGQDHFKIEVISRSRSFQGHHKVNVISTSRPSKAKVISRSYQGLSHLQSRSPNVKIISRSKSSQSQDNFKVKAISRSRSLQGHPTVKVLSRSLLKVKVMQDQCHLKSRAFNVKVI